MKQIKETAYAKINLGLDILGKREDGYHEVSMIMQSVGLSDEVVISKGNGIQISCGDWIGFVGSSSTKYE